MVFLCIKSFEYHDKFMHYQVNLKDGRIVDGHLQKAESTPDIVAIKGRYIDQTRGTV